MQPGGVYKIGLPRSDLHVVLDGVEVKPALALGSWLAFEPMGKEAMVMGDLVLTEQEVAPVMSALLAGGLTITALHNHVLRGQPATLYLHVGGHGDAVSLAHALHAALAKSATPLAPSAPSPGAPLGFDTASFDKAIGAKGKETGGVWQMTVPRAEPIHENGMEVPVAMGVATAINVQPLADGRAATTGDFVLRTSEVDGVVRALRAANIEVTAIHSHMLDEEPRLIFLHFWGVDRPEALSRGLKAALDATKSARG
jgi:hypothetical protein